MPNKRALSKKALSPLVSSVLLLAFAVGLGILIISWGKGTEAYGVEDAQTGCDKARISLVEVRNMPQLCISGNNVYFTIENNGAAALDGVKVSLLNGEIRQQDLVRSINVGDIGKLSLEHNMDKVMDKVTKIKVIPIIKPIKSQPGKAGEYKAKEYCPNSGFEMEEIKEC